MKKENQKILVNKQNQVNGLCCKIEHSKIPRLTTSSYAAVTTYDRTVFVHPVLLLLAPQNRLLLPEHTSRTPRLLLEVKLRRVPITAAWCIVRSASETVHTSGFARTLRYVADTGEVVPPPLVVQ